MDKKLLPIGTVVLLKESEGRIMISGYLPVTDSRPGYTWDYSGFRFPIGYVSNDEVYCFDADQVDEVIQYGFVDYEGIAFADKLKDTVSEIKKKTSEGE